MNFIGIPLLLKSKKDFVACLENATVQYSTVPSSFSIQIEDMSEDLWARERL